MSAHTYIRGHLVIYDEDKEKWVYAADRVSIEMPRPCVRCGRFPTIEGYDACLGYIPGVKSACCGHGVEPPYLVTNEGRELRGEEARRYLHEHQKEEEKMSGVTKN